MKGAIGVCVAASAIALAPCANADDDSFLANVSFQLNHLQANNEPPPF
jgi:hypothetical protein